MSEQKIRANLAVNLAKVKKKLLALVQQAREAGDSWNLMRYQNMRMPLSQADLNDLNMYLYGTLEGVTVKV